MKPMMILPPDAMSEENIKMLRDNGLCVVVANDPSKVSFVDPIPSAMDRTKAENAAIQLSRKILKAGTYTHETRANFAAMYVDLLVQGTSLDPAPTKEEREKQIFDAAKEDELRRLAREEAKAERLAAKLKK